MADVAPATEADAASKPPVETTEEVAPVDNAAAELSNMSLAEPPADTRIIRLFIRHRADHDGAKTSAHFSPGGSTTRSLNTRRPARPSAHARSASSPSSAGGGECHPQTTHIIDGRNVGTPRLPSSVARSPSALHSMDSRGNMPNSGSWMGAEYRAARRRRLKRARSSWAASPIRQRVGASLVLLPIRPHLGHGQIS